MHFASVSPRHPTFVGGTGFLGTAFFGGQPHHSCTPSFTASFSAIRISPTSRPSTVTLARPRQRSSLPSGTTSILPVLNNISSRALAWRPRARSSAAPSSLNPRCVVALHLPPLVGDLNCLRVHNLDVGCRWVGRTLLCACEARPHENGQCNELKVSHHKPPNAVSAPRLSPRRTRAIAVEIPALYLDAGVAAAAYTAA